MPRAASGPMPRTTGSMRRVPGAPSGPSGPQYGAQQYDGQQYDGQQFAGQAPWENGFPEADPNLKYRAPGPGMPGYWVPGDQYPGGDDLR